MNTYQIAKRSEGVSSSTYLRDPDDAKEYDKNYNSTGKTL
ncbi:unnamed protein product [Trichobilharzia regenti]|nr:unnamed protein product [Trichobilharzia regenti]